MHWVENLKQDEHKALEDIYRMYRSDCIAWLQNQFTLREDESLDIFQLSMIILYDSAMNDKVKSETSDVKSFLYGIARNKAYEILRQKKNTTISDSNTILHLYLADELPDDNIEESLNKARNALHILGDPCKSIIQMYYYKNQSMEEISQKMGYKNADTTKNQKYKCLKRLQSIYFSHLTKNEANEK